MPPPYPGIIGFTGNPGYASAPPAQTAPPPQLFNGQGINSFLFNLSYCLVYRSVKYFFFYHLILFDEN